jgi:hypothetical protein
MFSRSGSEIPPPSRRNTASNDHLVSYLLRHAGAEQLKCLAGLRAAIGLVNRVLSIDKSDPNRAAGSRRPKLQDIWVRNHDALSREENTFSTP